MAAVLVRTTMAIPNPSTADSAVNSRAQPTVAARDDVSPAPRPASTAPPA
jgi:hypothetical protein